MSVANLGRREDLIDNWMKVAGGECGDAIHDLEQVGLGRWLIGRASRPSLEPATLSCKGSAHESGGRLDFANCH